MAVPCFRVPYRATAVVSWQVDIVADSAEEAYEKACRLADEGKLVIPFELGFNVVDHVSPVVVGSLLDIERVEDESAAALEPTQSR